MDFSTFVGTPYESEVSRKLVEKNRSVYMQSKRQLLEALTIITPTNVHEFTKYCLILGMALEACAKISSKELAYIDEVLLAANKLFRELVTRDNLKLGIFEDIHDIFYYYSQVFVEQNLDPTSGIQVLQGVAQVISNSRQDTTLTPAHPHILKLCIAAKKYTYPMILFRKTMTGFSASETGIHPIDVMSFFYYKGYIQTALKLYDQAMESFRLVLSQPCDCIHQCLLSSYKKYILVSMLAGKQAEFPAVTSGFMKSILPKLCADYKELYDAFQSKNMKALQFKMVQSKEAYVKDKNYHLVELLPVRLTKTRVLELTLT